MSQVHILVSLSCMSRNGLFFFVDRRFSPITFIKFHSVLLTHSPAFFLKRIIEEMSMKNDAKVPRGGGSCLPEVVLPSTNLREALSTDKEAEWPNQII